MLSLHVKERNMARGSGAAQKACTHVRALAHDRSFLEGAEVRVRCCGGFGEVRVRCCGGFGGRRWASPPRRTGSMDAKQATVKCSVRVAANSACQHVLKQILSLHIGLKKSLTARTSPRHNFVVKEGVLYPTVQPNCVTALWSHHSGTYTSMTRQGRELLYRQIFSTPFRS
jgi:hypothetical protein